MRLTSRAARINGIDLVWVSAERTSSQSVRAALASALKAVTSAKGDFRQLIDSELRFVAAVNSGRSWVLPHARGYVSNFPSIEVANPHLLACRLVWAATFIALHRKRSDGAPKRQSLDELAHEAQLRFVRQFPGSKDWEEYLSRHE
jgi:hypothetical protein